MTAASAGDRYRFEWRPAFSNQQLNQLHAEAFGHRVLDHDWLAQLRRHSLGWVCAYDGDAMIGFVNVPWDGDIHAFIMDTAVLRRYERQGIGRRLIALAAEHASTAGCEWLHVDFDGEDLRRFYFDHCGFRPTTAGLIRLDEPLPRSLA